MKYLIIILSIFCITCTKPEYKVDYSEPSLTQYPYTDYSSILDSLKKVEIMKTSTKILPSDVEYVINGLGEISLIKNGKYISWAYNEIDLRTGYKWGGSPQFFKDTNAAKNAYFKLLEYQVIKSRDDSVAKLRNTIKKLKPIKKTPKRYEVIQAICNGSDGYSCQIVIMDSTKMLLYNKIYYDTLSGVKKYNYDIDQFWMGNCVKTKIDPRDTLVRIIKKGFIIK